MARVKYDLASQGLKVGNRGQGGLKPVRFGGGSGAGQGIRAPKINVNAANVQYHDMPVPKLQRSVGEAAAQGAANMGVVWEQAAFKLAERQAKADADATALAYKKSLQDGYYGGADADGNFKKGYQHSEMRDATDGYQNHIAGIDAQYEEMLAGLSESAREKAMLRMSNERNNYINRAAGHNAGQFERIEEDLLYQDNRSVMEAIANNQVDSWTDGTVETHLNKYKTQEQRDDASGKLAQHTMWSATNRTMAESGDDVMASYMAAERAYKAMAPNLAPDVRNSIEYKLGQQRRQAQKDAVKGQPAQRKKLAKELDNDSPRWIAGSIGGDTAEPHLAMIGVDNIRQFYDDEPYVGSEKVVSAVTGALDLLMDDPQLTTMNQRISAAELAWERLFEESQEEREGGGFDITELASIKNHLDDTLPAAQMKQQKRKQEIETYQMGTALNEAGKEGKPFTPQPAPKGYTDKGIEQWEKLQRMHANDLANGMYRDLNKREGFTKAYEALQMDGALTQAQTEVAFDRVINGDLPLNQYLALYKKNEELKHPSYVEPKYKSGSPYIAAKAMIQSLKGREGFTKDGKPKKEGMEQDQWAGLHSAAYNDALIDLNEKAKLPGFKADEWYTGYVKDVVNGGNTTGQGFWGTWNPFTGTKSTEALQNSRSGVGIVAGSTVDGMKQFAKDFMGDESIMEGYDGGE